MVLDLSRINAINQRAKTTLVKPVSTVSPPPQTPTPMATPVPRQSMAPKAPVVTSTPSQVKVLGNEPSLFQRAVPVMKNVMQKGFRALQAPSELTEKGITRMLGVNNYEEAYKQGGVPEPLQKPMAFGARMALDPLNLVGTVIKPASILGKLGKATGITEKIAPLVSKVQQYMNPMLRLPEELQYGAKMIPRNAALRTEQYVSRMSPIVEGMSTAAREASAKLLQGAEDAQKAFSALNKAQQAKVTKYFVAANEQRVSELNRALELGLITKKKYTEFMADVGKYYHATDFAKYKNTGGILDRFRQGVKTATSYFKKKTGAEGFTMDAPIAMAKREMKQIFDEEKAKFLGEIKKNVDYAIKLKRGQVAPEGFVKIAGEYLAGHRPLKGWAVRQDIFDAIIKPQDVSRGVINEGLAAINKLWKPVVTAWNPAFHAQNLLGNLSQMALGGVRNPKRFLQAVIGNIPESERSLAKSGGVLNTGQVMESLQENLGDVSKLADKNILQKIWESKYNPVQVFSKAGSAIENNARTAMYNDAYQKALKAGMTTAQAAQEAFGKTNKYLFDYMTGLGANEKKIRDWLPFYSWARFNMPLQAKEFLKQPSFFSIPGKLSRTMEPERQGVPDERGFSFPTPWEGKDGGKIRYAPNLPLNSLFDMTRPGTTALNMLTPAKNLPVIAANLAGNPAQEFGYNGPTGKPIITPGLPVGEKLRDAKDYLLRQFRPIRDIQSSANIGGVPGFLKWILGGFQNVNDKKNTINDLYRQQDLRSIRERRARELLRQGKTEQARSLLRSQQ